MPKVLIVAEHDNAALNPNVAKCVSCARQIDGAEIHVLVLSAEDVPVAGEASGLDNVTRVVTTKHPANAYPLAAVLAPQVVALSKGYTHILGPSSTFGRDLMPRVAALMGVNQISDIMTVEAPYRFRRPIYAGNAIVTVEAPQDTVVVATVRTASFESAGMGAAAAVEVATVNVQVPAHTQFIELRAGSSDRPDLQSAARVVAGGRALGSKESFDLVFKLADKLGAAVGASRAAVDAGYVSNDLQVGQTGKIIAPELYIAIGISGAIQHLTGIKDAGTIVAINKDADAPIFEVTDIGLAGDLFDVIPELLTALD